jgi:histone H3
MGDETFFFPLPQLDALSAETQRQRRCLAEAALNEEDRALMRAEGFHVTWEEDDEEKEEQRWGRQPLRHLQIQRLREIRWAQAQSGYIFPPHVFGTLCTEIGQVKLGLRFTAEDVECLQACTEDHLVSLVEDILLNTVHSNRLQLHPKDIQLARLVRGERN